MPSPASFGGLLRLLEPTDSELEAIVVPWAAHLAELPKNRLRGSERRREPRTPLGMWIDTICKKKGITIRDFWKNLDLSFGNTENSFGLPTITRILEKAPVAFGLSLEERDSLCDSVARVIQRDLEAGRKYQGPKGDSIVKIQMQLKCKTYNGEQVAKELGLTRERVRQLRNERGWPLLLLENQVEILRHRQKGNGDLASRRVS